MKEQNKLIILSALGVIFLIVVFIPKMTKKTSLQQPSIEVAATSPQNFYELSKKIIENYEVLNQKLMVEKDPFLITQPKSAKEEIFLPKINIQGILAGETPKVIIDGELLKEGDVIKGIKILRIESNKVNLLYKGKTFTLKIE
jgi:hypothetical protein